MKHALGIGGCDGSDALAPSSAAALELNPMRAITFHARSLLLAFSAAHVSLPFLRLVST